MSVKNLFIMLMMVTVFPLVIICYETEAFFILMSLILFFSAIGRAYLINLDIQKYSIDEDEYEDLDDELAIISEETGLNISRLGYGLMIAKNILVILYFLYTFFLTDILLLNAIAVILIANWVYNIIITVDIIINNDNNNDNESEEKAIFVWKYWMTTLYALIYNVATIVYIVMIFYLKYITLIQP